MLRPVTWRLFAVLITLAVIYAVLGIFYATNGRVSEDAFTWGLVAETLSPILFVTVYSVMKKAWWTNTMGLNLVLVELGLLPHAGVLAYTFLFDHGMLTTSWLAWIEIGSPWWITAMLLWRDWIFLRAVHDEKNGNGH